MVITDNLKIDGTVKFNQSGIMVGPYRYFRIHITNFYDNDFIVKVGDFRLIKDGTDYPTVDMTSNNTPSPLVASASSVGSSLEPWFAFDNDLATRWRNDAGGPPDWLQIDLGVGNELEPTGFKITNGNSDIQSPGDFTIEGSNDGMCWVILKTVIGETWTTFPETKIYSF